MIEAFRLFQERPLASVGLGMLWILVGALTAIPMAAALDWANAMAQAGTGAFVIAGIAALVWVVTATAACASFALLRTPLLVGVFAAAIRSARNGEATCQGWLTSFRHYGGSFVLGSVVGIVMGIVAAIPFIGPILSVVSGTLAWAAVSALADRQGGPLDALHATFAVCRGRFLPLMLLYLAAHLVGLAGALAACVGAIVTVPLMVLMLGIGYRDAADTAQVAPGVEGKPIA